MKDGKAGPEGPALAFEREAWSSFLDMVKTLEV